MTGFLAALPAITVLEPAVLAALAILPILWWLLRATPPAPRREIFPALRLLRGLAAAEQTPARTPWWVLLLRLVIAALLILGLARPVVNPDRGLPGSGPLLLVVDDGWAAAADWERRTAAMLEAVGRAERAGRDIWLLTTAPPADGGPILAEGPLTAAAARGAIGALTPLPWPVDRAAARRVVADLTFTGSANVVWIADGIASPDPATDAAFGEALQKRGGLEIAGAAPVAGLLLRPPRDAGAALALTVERAATADPLSFAVRAMAADGRVLARREGRVPAGVRTAEVAFDLPLDARNAVERIEIEDGRSAATVVLLDDRWRRRAVGIVTDPVAEAPQPLLSPTHYIERALEPYAEVRTGALEALLAPEPGRAAPSMIVLADAGPLTATARESLAAWVEAGGVALRFAGPLFAANPDPLIPVPLHTGDRSLSGALSWTTPMAIAPFPETGPFAGLPVPDDVRIERQVLADPAGASETRVWARLTDGTPLVTGARYGEGWLILVHTAADASWSSLPLSGLFVDMLRRLSALGQPSGAAAETQGQPLSEAGPVLTRPPLALLDGFGRLSPAGGAGLTAARALADPATAAGPAHPPGYYGRAEDRMALNLSEALPAPHALDPPPGATRLPLGAATPALALAPWLFAAALLLFALDLVVALGLRGLLRRRIAAAALAGLLLAALEPPAAPAQEDPAAAADRLHLAYVVTGDAAVDATSRAGLAALSRVLHDRTSADAGEPVAIDPATDELAFYPLLYWPVTATQPALGEAAIEALDAYLARGGMIVLDTRDGGTGAATGDLRRLTEGLPVPPLVTLPIDHVLTRTFYLLDDFPGRVAGAPVWVAATDATRHDGVSSVVISGADWAAAWATDALGRPLYPLEPGGDRQREMAYRVGVNLVLYALTGNYKADQVHVPAILERLGEVR